MKKSILLITFITACCFAKAQTAPAWVQFAAPSNYQNYDVQEVATAVDTSGNIYTAGSMIDTVADLAKVVLVKYNSAGVKQWMKLYDSSDPAHNGSYAVALLVDKSGNSYVCGYGRHNNSSLKDFMVVKFDNTGFQVWAQYWDGGQNEHDYPTCATFDGAGNILVAGYANTFGTTWDDMAVVKFGISGTQMWSYQYNNTASNLEDRVLSVASNKNSDVFITGSSYNGNARDMISMKLNSSGVNQWTKRIPHSGGNDDHGYSVAADSIGNSYVTGSASQWITIKYDPVGLPLWTYSYTANGLNSDNYKKVVLDKHNNPIVGGDAFFPGNNFSNLVVNKLDGISGTSMWSLSYNFGGIDRFRDMVLDTAGNVYISGNFEGPQGTDMSSAIITAQGTGIWSTTYTNPLHTAGRDMPYSMAVDKHRNVIMAGVAETRGSASSNEVDIITLRYDALVTGIATQKEEPVFMSIYPNPSQGQLTVSITDQQLLGSVITITNLMGQTIAREKITALIQPVSLNQAAKGIYMVNISNTKGSATKKLVIE